MAQSSKADQNQTVIVGCAASTIQRIATFELNNELNYTVATENPVTSIILNRTFKQFSNKCKDFTLAMSLKHQLQDSLFRQKNQDLTPHQINRLSSILIYLQTMANNLDDIQFRQESKHCVRLSAHGYRMMYHVRYGNTTSLLNEIKEQGHYWVTNGNYEARNCEELYPTNNLFIAE